MDFTVKEVIFGVAWVGSDSYPLLEYEVVVPGEVKTAVV